MKIESIALREIRMKLKSPFETSFGTVQDRRILLVEVVVDGTSGWGEVTAGETPAYNAETTDTAWHVISDFIAPSLIGQSVSETSELPRLMARIRGHEMAKSQLRDVPALTTSSRCWRHCRASPPMLTGRTCVGSSQKFRVN